MVSWKCLFSKILLEKRPSKPCIHLISMAASSATATVLKKNEVYGTTRNLTEVFMLLRSNAHQSRLIYKDDTDIIVRSRGDEERMALVELEDGHQQSEGEPVWVHTADQVEFEFERVQRRLDELGEAQIKHISRPNFGDEAFEKEERQMEQTTEQITQMLTHCQRLIRMISGVPGRETPMQRKLRENATATLSLTLSQITDEFRGRQLKYLSDIQHRSRNVDNYLITTDPIPDAPNWEELDVSPSTEISMAQLQQFMNNDREVREREKEVMAVNTSIRELNTLFQDLSQMIVDQGSVIDRIDYNVEQTSIRVSKAVEDVFKAERYQRGNKKMHCICILTVSIIFVLILIIVTKL